MLVEGCGGDQPVIVIGADSEVTNPDPEAWTVVLYAPVNFRSVYVARPSAAFTVAPDENAPEDATMETAVVS